MPRNTRAAARAQAAEAEITIATDETATESPQADFSEENNEDRQALVELTPNTVQEIEQEIDGMNKGKGTRGKSKRKALAKTESNTDSSNLDKRTDTVLDATPQENAEEAQDASTKHYVNVKMNEKVGGVSRPDDIASTSVHTEEEEDNFPVLLATPKLDVLEQDSLKSKNQAQVTSVFDGKESSEDISSKAHEDNPSNTDESSTTVAREVTVAEQSLQSLFQPPPVNNDASAHNILEALNTPLPPSPLKKTPTSTARGRQASGAKTSRGKQTTKDSAAKSKSSKSLGKSSDKDTATIRKQSEMQPRSTSGRQSATVPRSSIAALHTPPRPAKSSKPVTKSTFTLPSDAVREKLKAQKEERQKRQEQAILGKVENKQTRGVSIKPIKKPSSEPSHVSDTIKKRRNANSNGQPVAVKPDTTKSRKSSMGMIQPKKRATTSDPKSADGMSGSGRRSTSMTSNTPAAPVVRQNKAALLRRTGSVGGPSISKPRVSSVKPVEQKPEPKQEPKVETKKEGKAFDKAEAAKKARAEAAERGRAASREWAERKRREAEAKKTANKAKPVQLDSSADEEHKENIAPTPVP